MEPGTLRAEGLGFGDFGSRRIGGIGVCKQGFRDLGFGVESFSDLGLRVHAIFRAILGGFRKVGGTLFWGPYNKDPTTLLHLGYYIRVPYFGKLPFIWGLT